MTDNFVYEDSGMFHQPSRNKNTSYNNKPWEDVNQNQTSLND